MTINHVFIAFMIPVGIAIGVVLMLVSRERDFWVPPFFWILIAMALFELLAFARGRGAPGSVITAGARVLGFVLAVGLAFVIPMLTGAPARLF